MQADPSQPAPRTPAEWTAGECAEDLLAQLEELIQAGASVAQLTDALAREGLHDQTAAALAQLLDRKTVRDAQPALDAASVCGVDTVAFRQWFRRGAPQDPLVKALVSEGCPHDLATATIAQLAEAEAAFAAHHRARLRGLGVQAMVAGTGFTLALLWLASRPGPHGWWHALPVAATISLVGYGAVLRRRHAEPAG